MPVLLSARTGFLETARKHYPDMEEEHEKTSAVILVGDDEELFRIFVREALEQTGFEVCEASNGAQAIERFAS